MSILIQGMEMPNRCFECIFLTTVPNFFCLAGKRDLCAEHGINISRPDWCPLIELPPHGRLIDAVNSLTYPSSLMDVKRKLIELPPAQPKRGKWILDRSGAYCCSECMEPCAGYVMMKPRDKFCKMCGSRNEVTE